MRWEYKTLTVKPRSAFSGAINTEELEAQLNDLGREGWELVGITTQNSNYSVVAVLKRSR